jgi:superfamily II DNA or RNA helicase
MSLKEIQKDLKQEYRSDEDNIHRDFYVPCLTHSVKYDRAVGYFTSDSMALVARGLVNFVKSPNSLMRLVASPVLNEEDARAISSIPSSEQLVLISQMVKESLEKAIAQAARKHLEFLSWMIHSGKLQVKLAFRKNHIGIFHEKIGIFTDADGDSVVFAGSMNETGAGMVNNFESFDVYRQPDDDSRVRQKRDHFEKLWSNSQNNLQVIDFTSATEDLLKRYRRPDYRPPIVEAELFDLEKINPVKQRQNFVAKISKLSRPSGCDARPHQKPAINNWRTNSYRGILEMATGTGKTLTALFCLEDLQNIYPKLLVVIVAPYKHLCEQWAKDIVRFNIQPIKCFDSRDQWYDDLNQTIERLKCRESGTMVVCVTNSTFQSKDFLNLITNSSIPSCIIGDEVHNLGAKQISEILPKNFQFRIGLSATPVRMGDEEGTESIFDYFGNIIHTVTLDEAITRGILTPYEYTPIFVNMTKGEGVKYAALTARYARLASSKDPKLLKQAEQILFERANLIGAAFNKTEALVNQLFKTPLSRGLIYCSQGSVYNENGEIIGSHIDTIVERLRNLNPPVEISQFVHDVSDTDRAKLINEVTSGQIQGLAAIRCLDEGVDVPELQQAFILASSKNTRQYIQRRGRLLRRADNIQKEKAFLYDFIVVPPDFDPNSKQSLQGWETSLLTSELERFKEFARIALNKDILELQLTDLKEKYKISNESHT